MVQNMVLNCIIMLLIPAVSAGVRIKPLNYRNQASVFALLIYRYIFLRNMNRVTGLVDHNALAFELFDLPACFADLQVRCIHINSHVIRKGCCIKDFSRRSFDSGLSCICAR